MPSQKNLLKQERWDPLLLEDSVDWKNPLTKPGVACEYFRVGRDRIYGREDQIEIESRGSPHKGAQELKKVPVDLHPRVV